VSIMGGWPDLCGESDVSEKPRGLLDLHYCPLGSRWRRTSGLRAATGKPGAAASPRRSSPALKAAPLAGGVTGEEDSPRDAEGLWSVHVQPARAGRDRRCHETPSRSASRPACRQANVALSASSNAEGSPRRPLDHPGASSRRRPSSSGNEAGRDPSATLGSRRMNTDFGGRSLRC
jgi:hypothetical protein